MYKPNNKKMLTVLIAVAMVFSAFAILSFAAQPAYASSSGTVTYNPTTLGFTGSTFSTLVSTTVFVSGGTFSSGATIYFYLSSTDSSAGLVGASGLNAVIGSTVLTATSPTTLDQSVTFSSTYAGTVSLPSAYYILASDQNPGSIGTPSALTSFAFPATATELVSQTATLTILNALNLAPATGANALLVGGTGIAYGTGFDSGASVTVSLNYPGGTVLVSTTADASGGFAASFTVPALAGTYGTGSPQNTYLGPGNTAIPYTAVAQETNAYSSTYSQGGITADGTFDVGPSLTVSPADFNGAAGSTLTLTGTGFPGGATMTSSSTTSPTTSIEITNYGVTTGGTNTYHASVTVSATGSFTATVTTVGALTATGPYSVYIQMSDTSPYATTIDELFYPAVFVSSPNPQAPGFYFLPFADSVTGDYYPSVSSVIAAVYDFPAGATVSIYIGSTLLGSVTTDSLGYAMSSASTLPAMPFGSYVVTAVESSLGLATVPTTPSPLVGTTTSPLVLTAFFSVADPVGNSLASSTATTAAEYVPQNGTLTVSAYGLTPQTEYSPADSAITNIAEYGTNVTVIVGSFAINGLGFVPASNGTLIFAYQPFYGTYLTTGALASITITGVTGYEGNNYNYYEIGEAITALNTNIQKVGSGVTVTVTNLIPASGKTVSQYYPGTSDVYNLYIGSTEILSVPPTLSKWTGTVLALGITFDVPSLANGLYNISVVYAGQTVSNALPQKNTASAMLVVSSAGSSSGSGSINVVSTYSSGSFSGYAIVGYGLLSTSSVDLVIYNSLGAHTSSVVTSTAPDGAFFDTSDLSATGSIFTESAAGTFGVVLTINPGTASASEFYATYSVSASLFFSDASSPVGYNSAGVFNDLIGHTVTLTALDQSGLTAGTYYDLYFGSMYLETIQAVSATSFGTGVTFVVPTVASGLYNVSITYTGQTTPVATAPFYVLPSYYGTIGLTDAQGNYIEYAFPTQIVSFSWTPGVAPGTGASYGPVTVTVYLNGTSYESVMASDSPATLTGSFTTPNAAAGSYWGVSFGWTQTQYVSSTLGGSTLTSVPNSYLGTSMAYLQLVEGNGALLTGISSSEVATIEAAINSTVSTSLTVPISQLDAAITSINGAVATLKTTVGNISTDLSTINATVASISSGQALVLTDLGSISTSLASLNASLVAFNNNVVTINTTLGQVVTSLASIDAKVTSVNNGVATVQTSLGQITGIVTATSGNTSTIKTSLGTLNVTANQIKTNTQGFPTLEIFLIVIIVLVLITLVVSFLAVSAANKAARKVTEEKKQ